MQPNIQMFPSVLVHLSLVCSSLVCPGICTTRFLFRVFCLTKPVQFLSGFTHSELLSALKTYPVEAPPTGQSAVRKKRWIPYDEPDRPSVRRSRPRMSRGTRKSLTGSVTQTPGLFCSVLFGSVLFCPTSSVTSRSARPPATTDDSQTPTGSCVTVKTPQ